MSGTDTDDQDVNQQSPGGQDPSGNDADDTSQAGDESGRADADKLSTGWTWAGKLTRITVWGLAGSLAGLLATGVPLMWQYDPTRSLVLRDLHYLASLVFVIAASLLLGVAVVSRIRRWPTRVGWLGALAVFGLGQAGGASGLIVAWDTLFVDRDRPFPSIQGIFTAMRPEVELVLADGETITPGDYQVIAAAHIVVIPLVVVLTYVLSRRRNRAAEPKVT